MVKKLVLPFFCLILLFSCNDIPQHIITGLEGKPLPAIDLLLPDSITHINTQDAAKGSPAVLMYVNPDCQFCKAQLRQLKGEISRLRNIQFYIFTVSSVARTRELDNTLALDGTHNLYVGVDTKSTFLSIFDPPGYPYTAVYRSDQKLHAVFLGQTDINRIKEAATD